MFCVSIEGRFNTIRLDQHKEDYHQSDFLIIPPGRTLLQALLLEFNGTSEGVQLQENICEDRPIWEKLKAWNIFKKETG